MKRSYLNGKELMIKFQRQRKDVTNRRVDYRFYSVFRL